MRRFKNAMALALLAAMAAWGLTACGGVECGSDTKESDGKCVPIEQLSCAEGTTKADGKCVVGEKGCKAGTQFDSESNTCVAAPDACDMSGTSFDADSGKCIAVDWCADGTKKEGNECVPDCGDTAMIDDNGKCVADVAKVCDSMGGAVKVKDGACTIAEAACGAGTSLSANGDCVVGEEACGDGLVLADSGKCAPTEDVCDSGTSFDEDQGLCLPEATCQMGDVILNGVCVSPAEEMAANADHSESENNDPTMGGMANAINVKMTGMTTVFTGNIEAPRDIDGDGTMDQDKDAFSFTASTGDWFKVSVQSTGLDSPFFTISGPDGYMRSAATASTGDTARFFVAPKDGDYSIHVLPKELALDSDVGPIGSSDSSYVGALEKVPTPSPTAKDMSMGDQTLSGTASDLTDNLFDLQNLSQSDIYQLVALSAATDADLLLQVWEDPTTLSMTVDPLDAGATAQLDSVMGNRLVLVDWKKAWGPSLDFEVDATKVGSTSNPTIADGTSDTTTVTITPFTTLKVEQTNMSSADLDVEILDAMSTSVASDTVASGSSLEELIAESGTYTVKVTNNSGNSVSPDLTIRQIPPTNLGTLPTPSAVTSTVGDVSSSDVIALEFQIAKAQVGGIFFEAKDGYAAMEAELFDSAGKSLTTPLILDSLTDDTGLDEDAAGLYWYADTKATYYATLKSDSGSEEDVSVKGMAQRPLDLGAVAKGDTKSTTLGNGVANYMSTFIKMSASSDLGLNAKATPTGSSDSSLIIRDTSFGVSASDLDTSNPALDVAPVPSGTSFLEVRSDDGAIQPGYKVDLEFVTAPVPEVEPNNSTMKATPTNFGAKHFGDITSGNADYWKIDLQSAMASNEVLVIDMPADYEYDDWTCELLDGSSTSMQKQTDKDNGCAMLAGGLSAGSYYFKVSMGDTGTASYDLYITKETGSLESEPNDASGQATSVTYADWTSDTPIYGESEETSDSADFFSFSLGSALGSSESLIIKPEMLGPDATSLTYELQDSSNTSITSNSGSLAATGLAAGTYYLKVDGASSLSDGQYKIGAEVYSPDQSVTMSTATTFPNDNTMGKDTTVTASNCATVTRVTLDVDISHDYRGDVVIKLTNPAGTTVQVRDFVSYGYQDDIKGNYPLSLTPDGDLSKFNMASGNGTWTLNVSDQNDTYAGDGGTLNSWTLNLNCQ